MSSKVVYSLDTSDETFRDEYAKAMVNTFLEAHGIDPKRFVVGNSIRVMRRDSGDFQVRLWQTVSDKWPLCQTCDSCVEQEQVSVPLVAGVPMVADAFLHVEAPEGLPKVLPADEVAAAESAYQAALDSLHRMTEHQSRLVRQRAEELHREKVAREAQEAAA